MLNSYSFFHFRKGVAFRKSLLPYRTNPLENFLNEDISILGFYILKEKDGAKISLWDRNVYMVCLLGAEDLRQILEHLPHVNLF